MPEASPRKIGPQLLLCRSGHACVHDHAGRMDDGGCQGTTGEMQGKRGLETVRKPQAGGYRAADAVPAPAPAEGFAGAAGVFTEADCVFTEPDCVLAGAGWAGLPTTLSARARMVLA